MKQKILGKEDIISKISRFVNHKLPTDEYMIISSHSTDTYLDNFTFNPMYSSIEEFGVEFINDKCQLNVKLLDNLICYSHTIKSNNTTLIRLFIVEINKENRYFSSLGSNHYFGKPTEHTEMDFIELLENHRDLQDDEKIKNMLKNILIPISVRDLENELSSNTNIKNNKPKI